MTKKEAKDVLQEQIDRYGQEYDEKGIEALNVAIEALEQEPYFWEKCPYYEPDIMFDEKDEYDMGKCTYKQEPKTEPCDCISRAELLKAIDTWDKFGFEHTGCFVREPKDDFITYIHYDDVIKCIKGLPSVQPKTDVLDKIIAEIEQTATEEQKCDEKWAIGLRYAVKIIEKYREEVNHRKVSDDMSGGSMEYVYLHIKEAAELTEDETIAQLLMDLSKVLHDEEWAECCDISDEEYQDTLLNFKRKWLEQEPKTDTWSIKKVADALEKHGLIEQEPCEDFIDRADAMTEIMMFAGNEKNNDDIYIKVSDAVQLLRELPSVEQEPKTGHCKDCKYFEYNSVAKVDGIPLIVAHEICSRWGDGCKTKEDGYCFLFEKKQESEDK